MAHFAKVYINGVVEDIIVATQEYIDSLPIEEGFKWVKTSYNTRGNIHHDPITNLPDGGEPFRKNYAQVGGVYDETRDAFIPVQPFNSWVLNEETCLWEPPIPRPVEPGKYYFWSEMKLKWVEDIQN